MRALLDRPATLPVAGAALAVGYLAGGGAGLLPTEALPAGLLLGLALAVAGFLPAVAPSLVALAVITGGGLTIVGVPVDGVVVGMVVLWSTARRLGPWTRSLALAAALLLSAVGGLVVASQLSGALDPSAASGQVELLVRALAALLVASVLGGLLVLAWVLGIRSPVGPDDPIDALLVRVAGPQDPFAVGAAGGQAVLLLAIACVPLSVVDGSLQVFVAGVLSVALVLHRRAPAVALGVAWIGAILQMALVLPPGFADLAIFVVLFGTGAAESRRVRTAGAVSAVVGSVVAVAYLVLAFDLVANTTDVVLTVTATFSGLLATLGLSWTVGLLSRSVRRAREGQSLRAEAERERARAQRELDAVGERNRIARDMHDVVAHSLAVVIAQADGARYLGASSPEQTDAALLTISSVARDALGDVRVLLAQLRHSQSDGPQPAAHDLPALLDSVSGAGAQVHAELDVDLDSVPRATGIALYRIAQEATTNALRHGRPGAPLDVALRRDAGEIVLTVRNARCGDVGADAEPGEGHGLVGMHERAALVGGVLLAGPDGEDFVVDARLPAGATSPVPIIGPAPSSPAPALPVASGGRPA
ncbi:Signal transduction histidine kinase [Rathayibacter oskolensis]|uniref:histidine kinase n=1 Tax=Rathayibacter oskolensis TaxID=1891671 RepID=A0A1X7NDX7_9MICO|nr:histidine kinase [Rathayibacter oskolensis]SMH35842.1 Signal transduction histidine kinase [Rathayibacter oskolensis]